MAETLTNTTNEKGNNNDNLVSSVKKAAAILVAALGLTVATSQDVNAQMFNDEEIDEVAEMKAEGKKLDNENAEKRNTIAGNNEDIAKIDEDIKNQEKIIAGLRADLGKDSKNPLKSNRSSFAYNSTKPKDNSKKGRGLNN